MPPINRSGRGLFTEFEAAAREATSNVVFSTRFNDASKEGDRSRMIGQVLSNLDHSPIIRDFYRGKDKNRSDELVQLALDEDTPEDNIPAILTEALLSAPFRTELFFEIIALRARAWARIGDTNRSIKDCKYFNESIVELRDESFLEKRRVDMLLLYADCCKAQGGLCEYRSWLNEAMKRIEKLAKKLCLTDKTDEFRSRKAEVLNEFLERKQKVGDKVEDASDLLKIPEIPTIDGRTNEFLSSCSDAVTLSKDKTKGRMLVATRNIKPGSVLIVDRPYSFTTDFFALNRNCLNCHVSFKHPGMISVPCMSCRTVQFCSEDCRKQAWDKFHQYECRIFDYFADKKLQKTSSLLAYRTVVIATALYVQDSILELDRGFLQVHENDKNILDVKTLKRYESLDYKTVFALKTHSAHADPKSNLEKTIHSIFLAHCLLYSINHFYPEVDNLDKHLQIFAVALFHNMQAINCNAYEIVENVRDNETKILEPRNVGGAIYTSVSLTNHSCYPNIVRHSYPCGTVVVKSIRFIPQGAEILDCYGQHFLENDKESRQKLLEQKYYFECQCQACMREWPMKLPSDIFNFKCKNCSKRCRRTRTHAECATCNQKTEISKLYTLLQGSIKKRLSALTRMYDGNYQDALPLLLEHANCIDNILSEPSLEAVKTQQSIIQCLNAMSSTSV